MCPDNVYSRFRFCQDVSDALREGEITYPEMEALIESWPLQIIAIHYADFTPAEASVLNDCCGCVDCHMDSGVETEGEECCDECCSEPTVMPPLVPVWDETMRTYTFPGGHQIQVGDVVGIYVDADGAHFLQTQWGEKFWIPPRWIGLQLQ